MTLVDDHVLIANVPLWNAALEAGERYTTEIAAALRGNEDRAALQQKPWRFQRLDYALDQRDDRMVFDLAVREGLRTGRVAIPYWPRPEELTDVSGSVLTVSGLWSWSAGDYAWLEENGAGEAVQIASIAGDELTLEDPPAGTYEAGCARLYPLLFGRIEMDRSFVSLQEIEARLTFTEPSAVGDFVEYTCPTPPTIPVTASFNVCEGVPEPTLVTLDDECPTQYRVQWPSVFGASDYVVYESTTEDGEFSEGPYGVSYDAETGLHFFEFRPVDVLHLNRYIRVTSIIGDVEGEPSAVVAVPTITIERVMRAVQERYQAVSMDIPGAAIDWTDRTLPSSSDPGDFPANEFYLADLQANVATAAPPLVNAIRNAFLQVDLPNDWLDSYASGSFDGASSVAAITRHDTTSIGLPAAADGSNYLTILEALAECLCALEVIVVHDGEMDTEDRAGTALRVGSDVPDGTDEEACDLAQTDATTAWNADAYTSSVQTEFHVIERRLYSIIEEGENEVTRTFSAIRGSVVYDLVGKDMGTMQVYFLGNLPTGGDAQFSKTGLAPAPGPAVDGELYLSDYVPDLDTLWSSPQFGNATLDWELACSALGDSPSNIGWRITDHVIRWNRLSEAEHGHWTYYA